MKMFIRQCFQACYCQVLLRSLYATKSNKFYFIFCFNFPFLIIFCACALERTQAAETEYSTDSRWNLLHVGSLIVCIVYTITANIQCVQGRIGQTSGAYFTRHLVSLSKALRVTLQRSKLALFLLDLYPPGTVHCRRQWLWLCRCVVLQYGEVVC